MKKKTSEDYDPFKIFALSAKLGKCKIAILAAYFLALYICLTSVTCVTADGILVKTPFDPVGKEYSYADVERIEAGFGEKKRAFYDYEQKGSFYYKVILDGKERIFHMPTVNGDIERYNDTYLELEEFDAALKALNIPKYASKKGYENCKFDSRYIERFLRILDD
jgi:hypothetical protein